MNERLVALEERYTLLQHQVDQLDGVVLAQARELDALTREVSRLREALARVAASRHAAQDEDGV
jgi:uncharacterized coiled-coil protein SlyX